MTCEWNFHYLSSCSYRPLLNCTHCNLNIPSPLSATSPIDRFVSILRISSARLLDFPTVHATAKEVFVAKFPHGPLPGYRPNNILEALALATEYRLEPVSYIILYYFFLSIPFL